ncbi:MAG: HipA domain-containing protein [Burkholderiaceae bacterium]|nr:HipA domain-containing protein [Burkholderiaceae bacterium]
MTSACTIQLHAHGQWHDAATVQLLGDSRAGWRTPSYAGYAVEWAFAHPGARDAHALTAQWPVGLETLSRPHWPVFLIDLLPQGFGRQEMLRRLGLPAGAEASADWRLLLSGAGNPIGHLRVKEAAEFLALETGPRKGFSDAEVAARSENFAEHLASHGLFVAGSSGVQGEWPKILLTRAKDGLLYLDHTLPDTEALAHYLIKFGRGPNPQLAQILALEAPYMALASLLGLRVHAPLTLRERALFIPRFDRRVQQGRTVRLAQESIASLTGMPGFDKVPSHNQVCAALLRHCTHPEAEIIEYLRRDVANLALGNKDNHARNTAVQRDLNGRIALTPLFDFAPMYLHPDGIARRIRWEGESGGQPDWNGVIDQLCALAEGMDPPRKRRKGAPPLLRRDAIVAGLQAMLPGLERIVSEGPALGLLPEVHAYLLAPLRARIQELRALRHAE